MRTSSKNGQQIRKIISDQEEKMRNLRRLFKLKHTAWSLIGGLMLAGLLGGCQTPFIDIKVQVDNMAGTCPSGGTTRVVDSSIPLDGGCTLGPILTAPADAYGAHIHPTGGIITDHNHTCTVGNGSRKCASSPGTCNFKACWTRFVPDSPGALTGKCSCDCQF